MRWAVLATLVCACSGGNTITVGDGRVIECDPEVGSICATGTRLVRCDQNPPTVTDCSADGKLCGADPQNPVASTCVSWGGSCGEIRTAGVCSGDVLTRCNARAELRVIDCGERGASCALYSPSERFECTDACRDLHVGAEGQCTSGLDGINHCVYENGVYSVRTDDCPPDTFCRGSGPDTAAPTCVPLCGAVGWTGRCTPNDVLTRCDGSRMMTTDCAADGRVCAWSDRDGYHCASVGTVGSRLVTGRVTYEDREVHDGLLGPPIPKRVRSAAVALIAETDGRIIATAVTNDLGEFTIRYDAANTQVRVLVVAASLVAARPVRVLRPDGLLHSLASAPFAVAARTDVDLLATERSGLAEAFNILDVFISGQDMVRAAFDLAVPRQVTAVWGIDSSNGTTTSPQGTVFLLGGLDFVNDTYDDDGYDDAVMAHEFGHTIEFGYGRTNNPGGRHSPFVPVLPVLGWSEGFADWASSAIRQDTVYTDTNGLGGFFFDIDTSVTPVDPQGPMTQEISENTVAEILWDLSDAPVPDDDPVAGTVRTILRVERNYFGGTPGDRGVPGVDLVDFLDGYLILGGQELCEGTRAVVGSRSFPYDFAGPTPCP